MAALTADVRCATHTPAPFSLPSLAGSASQLGPSPSVAESSAVTALDCRLSQDLSDLLQGQFVRLAIHLYQRGHGFAIGVPAIAVGVGDQKGIFWLEMINKYLKLGVFSSVIR